MIILPPQHMGTSYFEFVEDQLIQLFYDIIFAPIMAILAKATPALKKESKTITNAKAEGLRAALQSGRVRYNDGVFTGEFSASSSVEIRRMGGSFDKKTRSYRIESRKVPGWVLSESAQYAIRATEVQELLEHSLAHIQANLDHIVDIRPINASVAMGKIEEGFKKASKSLEVMPTLTEEAKEKLAQEYSTNMKLWVKNFSHKTIGDLRELVEQNALEGYRADSLVSDIKSRYSVTTNKAKFLARNETSLFMAKYRESRFKDAGVTQYIWQTAHDERVRMSHKALDGKAFSYDNPPIVDVPTSSRANPGAFYNCRCVDRPFMREAIAA